MNLVFSNIVVGTDGSETAAEAVALAVQLARQNHAKLHLVVGVHTPAAVAVPSGGASVSDPVGRCPARGMPHSACWRVSPRESMVSMWRSTPSRATRPM